MHQAYARRGFQLLDVASHGIGRDSQPPRRSREASNFHDPNEQSEVVEVEHSIITKFGILNSYCTI